MMTGDSMSSNSEYAIPDENGTPIGKCPHGYYEVCLKCVFMEAILPHFKENKNEKEEDVPASNPDLRGTPSP